MAVSAILTALTLPPLGLSLAALAGLALAWRGWRPALLVACAALLMQLLLATPFVAGWLIFSLEGDAAGAGRSSLGMPPTAIVVLGGDSVSTRTGANVGPLTLERLRAGAALHRRTGLPLLVTGGPLSPDQQPLAMLMARSLEEDFGVAVRWIEPLARDTRDNAVLSIRMLHHAGADRFFVVTHGWHMPRAIAAFERAGGGAVPAPLPLARIPDGRPSDWLPRADRLGLSWFMLREWAGQVVYSLRD